MKSIGGLIIMNMFVLLSCGQQIGPVQQLTVNRNVRVGAERTEVYLEKLRKREIAIVANPTSLVKKTHLVDTLLTSGIHIKRVFAPEHGFRGESGAGETIKDGKDNKTGLPVTSLYGKNKKPTAGMLEGIEVIVFDIQDVGARFYTYISTMHYVMEAAAENGIEVIILDRPNPNGFFIDGPVLDLKLASFVGMHPIPVVHGCTIGELARMINGEGWLEGGIKCELEIIPCENYTHNDLYNLPVKPSPNLPNMSAVYLYPSLCLFEGTTVSVGRGTELPFQCIGYPGNTTGTYHFTPHDIAGVAIDPPHEGVECTGHNIAEFGSFYFCTIRQLYLEWLDGLYRESRDKEHFFTSPDFFDKLAGTTQLREQITNGVSLADIRKSWEPGLSSYKQMRRKYLLYPDFS